MSACSQAASGTEAVIRPVVPRFGSQGLLAGTNQWVLPLGLSAAPFLLWCARALLVSVGLLFLSYTLAFLSDARNGSATWGGALVVMVLFLAWGFIAWRTWWKLAVPGHLTLAWCELPLAPSVPAMPMRRPRQLTETRGWMLPEHEQAAVVKVVFDLGSCLLLRVQLARSRRQVCTYWTCLTAAQLASPSGHHLRSLLFCARPTEMGGGQDPGELSREVVASFGVTKTWWVTLFPHYSSTDLNSRLGVTPRRGRGRVRTVRGDFAATILLNPATDILQDTESQARTGKRAAP